jgi:hypothetical protein
MNTPRSQPERGPRAEGPARVDRPRQAQPQEPNRQRQRATERERSRATEREQSRTIERSGQRRNAERERKAERARSAERERAGRQEKGTTEQRRAAEQPSVRRDREAAERGKGGERVAERREEMRHARDRLGPDERRRLHSAFDLRRARVTNAKFDWHVGHRVPRHVHLYPVPREIISFFPYYRDYSYVVVDDEICIVDRRTYEIVDVIDQGYIGGSRHEIAGLSLSSEQMAFVRDGIPGDFPEADVRLRLALGAEVPREVEIFEFPVIVLDRLPQLRDYRFLVAAAQIVIVNPGDRSIALVIDRA